VSPAPTRSCWRLTSGWFRVKSVDGSRWFSEWPATMLRNLQEEETETAGNYWSGGSLRRPGRSKSQRA